MKGEFYKMEYEAWDEGTDELSLELEGAYLRLCHQMYRRRGPVPANPATLARIWRCHTNKARKLLADLIALGKVTNTPEGLTQTRVTQELDARETRSTHLADVGRTGGTRTQENRRKSLKSNDQDQADAGPPFKQIREEEKREEEMNAGAGAPAAQANPDPIPKPDPEPVEPLSDAWLRRFVGQEPVLLDLNTDPVRQLLGRNGITVADIEAGILAGMRDPGFRPRRWSSFVGWIERAASDRLTKQPKRVGPASSPRPIDPKAVRAGQLLKAKAFLRGAWEDGWRGPRPGEVGFPDDIAAEAARELGVPWPAKAA
jgi:uncharacterized protein YdaU (DUF1376 family)